MSAPAKEPAASTEPSRPNCPAPLPNSWVAINAFGDLEVHPERPGEEDHRQHRNQIRPATHVGNAFAHLTPGRGAVGAAGLS